MKDVTEAINYYRQRKMNSELSIHEIRKELEHSGNFNAAEVSEICRTISDDELSQLKTASNNPLAIFNHILFTILLIPLFAYLSYVAYKGLDELWTRQSFGKVDFKITAWRYFIMVGALFFLLRNCFRVVRHFRRKS